MLNPAPLVTVVMPAEVTVFAQQFRNVRTLAELPLQCLVIFDIMGKARFSFPAVDADFVI